jgi:hypothetical protein
MLKYKNQLLAVLLSALLVLLFGCGKEANAESNQAARKVVHITTENGVDCVTSRAVDSYRGGISCNWQKYNDKIKACKKESLKRRTMKDGMVFPATEGECEKAH